MLKRGNIAICPPYASGINLLPQSADSGSDIVHRLTSSLCLELVSTQRLYRYFSLDVLELYGQWYNHWRTDSQAAWVKVLFLLSFSKLEVVSGVLAVLVMIASPTAVVLAKLGKATFVLCIVCQNRC